MVFFKNFSPLEKPKNLSGKVAVSAEEISNELFIINQEISQYAKANIMNTLSNDEFAHLQILAEKKKSFEERLGIEYN